MPDAPRIAVVGLGSFGRLHAETLRGLGGARLSAIVEADTTRRDAASRELGTPRAFGTLDELIAAKAADAIIIATRNATHVPLSLEALEAGLHVFIEKPAGESERELEQLLECRQKTGRVAMVDHICLFHSLIDPFLRRVVETGFRAAHFVRHRPATLAERFPESHPLRLSMVHDLYTAARMVRGEEPSAWHFMESRGSRGTVDMTWASLRWPDGRTATFQSHWTLPPGSPPDGWDQVEVFGDGFHSLVKTNPAPWQWSGEKCDWPVALEISNVQGRPTGMLAEAQRAFVAAIRGEPVREGCRVEDALQVERWMARLERAAAGK